MFKTADELFGYEEKFGCFEDDGIMYYFTDIAEPTSRLLPEPQTKTHFEMAAPAIDTDGNKYNVRWVFEKVEGQDEDMYDYSPENIVYIDSL